MGSEVVAQMQIHDPQSIISDIVEEIVATSEEDVDLDALIEDLIYISENPINLNTTSREELGRLFFLSDFQITSLLDYTKLNGPMVSIYELQLVIGFDYTDISRLIPFVTLTSDDLYQDQPKLFKYGKHDLFIRGRSLIETQEGYTPAPSDNPDATRYLGNKLGLYTRYSYKSKGGIQLGFVGEKDPGEEFFEGSNPYGFDHYSFHFQLSDRGKIKSFVLGDFNAEFGQGLALWTSTSFGKSPDPMGVRKRGRGLSRSSSTNENEYLRGAGATIKLGAFDLSVFGSYKKIDANISDSLIDGITLYSSRPTSGLHRTPNEIRNKKTLGEFVAGGNVSFSMNNFNVGLTSSIVNLDGLYQIPEQPYRYFEPPLENRVNIGIDFNYGLGNHLLFGEVATTLNYGSGIVGGGLFRLHPLLNLSISGRHYQKDFSTYYTGALSDGSSPSNESGILSGIQFNPYQHWQLAGYIDFFQSSWLRYGVNAPSRGKDYLFETTYSPRSNLSFVIRYKLKQKEKNQDLVDSQIQQIAQYNNQALRFHLVYSPSKSINLKTRLEFSWYNEENIPNEKGTLLYQDISYRPPTYPLVLTARFAIFDTDSWNTRIYAYESDVLYYFSIPAYYSRGTRAYLLAQYTLGQNFDIWLRVAQTYFAHQDQLGSGLDMIDGSTRSDFRIQIRYKF